MPPLVPGKRYCFKTTEGRLNAEYVGEVAGWLEVKMAKGDAAWFRASSLINVAETAHKHGGWDDEGAR